MYMLYENRKMTVMDIRERERERIYALIDHLMPWV